MQVFVVTGLMRMVLIKTMGIFNIIYYQGPLSSLRSITKRVPPLGGIFLSFHGWYKYINH